MKRLLAYAGLAFALSAGSVRAASNLQFTIGSPDSVQWMLSSVGSTSASLAATYVFSGALPASNPTINLIKGKRYGVTDESFGTHYFEIIAGGDSDTILLSEAPGLQGTLETDSGINWTDDGAGHIEFTVTQSLINGLRAATPGYRCAVHPTSMRGNFAIFGDGTKIANPIPAALARGTQTIELVPVAQGLVAPLGLIQSDSTTDTRSFIYDQVGKVYILQGGSLLPTPFLDVSSRLVTLSAGYDERGLIGFALHPNFATTRKVYTYTSEPVNGAADFTVPNPSAMDHQGVFAEWTVSAGNANVIDPASRREILRIDKPQFNHNGGTIRFGPDGMLYIGLGDGGNADDQGNGHDAVTGNAQNLDVILGKILRINVDGNNSTNGKYGVPADNPTLGTIREVWAYGVRNPYSFSFDKVGGTLFLGEVGQNDVEEVDVVTKGSNYGWRYKEGAFFFDPNGNGNGFVTTVPPVPIPSGLTLIDPIAQYDHGEGNAIVGGYVYRGTGLAGFAGRYVCGNYGSPGRLFYINSANALVEFKIGSSNRALGALVKGFGQDRAGEVYVCVAANAGPSGTTGQVLKMVGISDVAPKNWSLYTDPAPPPAN